MGRRRIAARDQPGGAAGLARGSPAGGENAGSCVSGGGCRGPPAGPACLQRDLSTVPFGGGIGPPLLTPGLALWPAASDKMQGGPCRVACLRAWTRGELQLRPPSPGRPFLGMRLLPARKPKLASGRTGSSAVPWPTSGWRPVSTAGRVGFGPPSLLSILAAPHGAEPPSR